VTLVALLDSGASLTLVSEKFAEGLKLKQSKQGSVWTTPAGKLKTNKVFTTQMSLPELHDNRVIEWTFHVIPKTGAYDIIIGRDILHDLGFILDFDQSEVHWDHASIPFKDVTKDVMESFHVDEPEAAQESMSRVKRILDNDYGEADLHEVARAQTHLTQEEQGRLEELL
jgi:Aspartyl protease